MVAGSTADREVRGSNHTLAQCKFLRAQEMNPLDQGVNWYPERVVSVQVRYPWAPYIGCTQNRE